MCTPTLMYEWDDEQTTIRGFHAILRFMGRILHMYPSNYRYAADVDSLIDLHGSLMSAILNPDLYHDTLVSALRCMDEEADGPHLGGFDGPTIADVLWQVTIRDVLCHTSAWTEAKCKHITFENLIV